MSTKQVIVMRKDLNMRKGKMAAQSAHASMAIFTKNARIEAKNLEMFIPITEDMFEWFRGSFKKIVVGVNSEEELMEIYNRAYVNLLPVSLITDSGLTEFNGVPTKTCVAIGPAKDADVDEITGELKLL